RSPSSDGWRVANVSLHEARWNGWTQNGRVVVSQNWVGPTFPRDGLADRLSFGPTSTVFVNELVQENLEGVVPSLDNEAGEKHQEPAELFLLESSKAPRPQLTDFLRRNTGTELTNLAASTEHLSSIVHFHHQH